MPGPAPCSLPMASCAVVGLSLLFPASQAAVPSVGIQGCYTCPFPNDTDGLSRFLPSLYFLGDQIQSGKGQGKGDTQAARVKFA